jgi:hypothetical protein
MLLKARDMYAVLQRVLRRQIFPIVSIMDDSALGGVRRDLRVVPVFARVIVAIRL